MSKVLVFNKLIKGTAPHLREVSIGIGSGPPIGIQQDPFVLRFERLALASSELVGVAETGRARVVG